MDLAQGSLLTAPAMQRAAGVGVLECKALDGRTGPARLRQEGCAKLRLLPSRGGALEALMVNTAGGLTGGDALDWRVAVGERARAAVSTTGCERLYRSTGADAAVSVRLEVGAGAALDWLPQETILFDGARLRRTLEADVAADGRLLAVESVLLGRRAMGEVEIEAALHDRWRVRRDGALLFADDIRLEGELIRATGRAATLDGGGAYAALLLVAPDAESHLEAVRAAIGPIGGASAFDGRLFCRIVAQDGFALRRALVPALRALKPGLESLRVWSF